MKSFWRRCFCLLIILGQTPLTALYVQASAPDQQRSAQEQQQQQQQWLRDQQRYEQTQKLLNAPSARFSEPVAAASLILPSEKNCYPISQFLFVISDQVPVSVRDQAGTTLPQDTFYFLTQKIRSIHNHCIGQQGMVVLINYLTLELIKHGYTTTRVGIEPDQNLSSGILKIGLLPGYIKKFSFSGNATANVKTAFPTNPGKILNLRDIEQGLEQLQRVSSYDVSMQLIPAESPGGTDVVLNFSRRKPWRLAFTANDSGLQATGRRQGGINIALDDPLGLNDTLNIGVNNDIVFAPNTKGTKGRNINYSIPWGRWTITGNAAQNLSYQTLPGQINKIINQTDNASFDMQVSYMFLRDQVQKNTIAFRVGKNFATSVLEIQDVGYDNLEQQYRNTTFAEWSWQHRRFLGPATFNLNLAYRWGRPWLGATDDQEIFSYGLNSQNAEAILHYHFTTVDATLTTPFLILGKTLSYSVNFHGQFTKTPQDGINMFSIGNRYTVRGFDGNQTLAAEQGYYLRNEFEMPLGNSQQSIYWGLDVGKVFGSSTSYEKGWPYQSTKLAGTVLGLRGGFVKGMSYDVFIGARLYAPLGFQSENPVAGFTLRQEF